jgi:RHS repeat-associated protein
VGTSVTEVTKVWPTAQFAYNGDRVRTSKTVAGDTTEYALDLAATLPVVISDTEAVYLYGLDILAQQQSERLYYVHDGLGSVRQLLDTTGEIQTNYAYDPFGVPVMGGDEYNPYQYTGEAWDAEVELLYLRARYYQPEVGRFITKDPWAGEGRRPTTLNAYPYVVNNPVAVADPSGLWGPGAFTKPSLPEAQYILDVARTFQIPPELLGALLQTVVDIDYSVADFVEDVVVEVLVLEAMTGPPPERLLGELGLNMLPETVSTGLAQMQYGTAKSVEDWLARAMAENPGECKYLGMVERLPPTRRRSHLALQLLLPGRATVYAAAYLRQIMESRFGPGVDIAKLTDEAMAFVAALYNAGLYSDIEDYSENKFGNYVMNNHLLDAWRAAFGISPHWELSDGRL